MISLAPWSASHSYPFFSRDIQSNIQITNKSSKIGMINSLESKRMYCRERQYYMPLFQFPEKDRTLNLDFQLQL